MQAYRSGDKEGHMGVMHKRLADEEIVIVENYLAKNDETIGGQQVKAGTWLQGLIFKSDTLWEQVKTGVMTGLSIGGTAIRTPVSP
jgi:DNA adenine methylase